VAAVSRLTGEVPAGRRHRAHLDPDGASVEDLLARAATQDARTAAERFRKAAGDLAAVAPPADAPVLENLATAGIAAAGQVARASNAVFLLELEAADPHVPDQPMRAIYKPARGERPLWDFPRRTLHLRERAAYLLSAALGMEVVPPTVLRDGPVGPGSVQLYIHPRTVPLDGDAAAGIEAQLRRLAAFDVLANNADRKATHLLVDGDGHLWGIDNALTFLPYPRQRTALLELGGSDLADGDAALVRRLRTGTSLPALRAALGRLLTAEEVAAFDGRLEELADDPWYPRLDGWGGRPFEWW
jgi:hypothetical protein